MRASVISEDVMRVAYFDCFSGASGDMIISAMLDAGASFDNLQSQLGTLPLSGFEVSTEKIKKQGFAATSFHVHANDDHPHRHLQDVIGIIQDGKLSKQVTEQACRIFRRLAEAEAAVHHSTVEEIHFHEVGAVDAIVDVTGACVALENLGIQKVVCSAIPTGSGTVKCAHGILPIPAPATAELLKHVPIALCEEVGELTTPTGAAILTTLAREYGPLPAMTLDLVGYGAGQREGHERPNLLRVLIGESPAAVGDDTIAILEANIDDQSPEIVSHATGKLLERGALDAFCQPIYMKKGRLGLLLTVLCRLEQISDMEAIIFSETTTFGVRRQLMQRSKLERSIDTETISGGAVRIKVGSRFGKIITASPEFEDCRKLADKTGRSVKEIMSQVMKQWHGRHESQRIAQQ